MNIANARVLLTGAVGGIGTEAARQLGRSGATLLLTDLSPKSLDQLLSELRHEGIRAAGVAADVTSEASRAKLVEAAQRVGINILVNIAGVNPFGMFEEQTEQQIAAAIQINTIAPMLLCRALLPVLHEHGPSQILNLGSSFGSIGYPGFAVYSASKFAVRGFSEALRRELDGTGVSVQYVAPRATQTRLATDRIRAMNEELKVGMDSPEFVACAIVDALRRGRKEKFLGTAERFFARLNGVFPGLIDRAVAKQLPIVRRYAVADDSALGSRDVAAFEIHQHG